MSYAEAIIARIKDPDKWPAHLRGELLDDLNEIADDAFSKGTIEGYLASILIYIQITEELVNVLLESCEFFIQLGIFPTELQFKHGEKRMFGQILNDLENTISFKDKDILISKCKQLNNLRNKLVHNLTKHTSIEDIKRQSSKIKEIFDSIFEIYDEVYDGFRGDFSHLMRNGDWDEWLEEEIEEQ